MRNWSSWQGYGWLIHVCTGVYILSLPGPVTGCRHQCAASAALDRFPLVAGTKVHRDHHQLGLLCSFLGLFAPVHAQDAQIRSAAHSVLAAALLVLKRYQNIILMLQKE